MNILQKSSTPKCSEHNFFRRHTFLTVCLLAAFLLLLLTLSLCFGSVKIDLWKGIGELFAGDTDSADARILLHLRLPRALGALFAGAALAVAGVLIQGVLHNPMAAPNIIGVNSGAGLGAILMISVFPSAVSFLPLAAFCGAVGACACIYALAKRTGADRLTVTLVGIAVGAILNAGINTVKTLFPDSVYDADAFMIGGLSGVTYSRVLPAGILICLALISAFLLARDADILSLGDDTAKTLGLNVTRTRWIFLLLASVLAGAAVSFAGLLGFVGLVVPHICRRFTGQVHRHLLPVSALGGGVLVLLCDLLCRILFAPYEIPVGILLSLVGGPFFIVLILSGRKRRD